MGGRGGGSPGRRGIGDAVPSDVPPGATAAEQAVINAYWSVVKQKNVTGTDKWVRLSDIRPKLSAQGLTFAQQDEALRDFALRRDTRVVPIENLKSMTRADHLARLQVGGQPKDAILMYTPRQFD